MFLVKLTVRDTASYSSSVNIIDIITNLSKEKFIEIFKQKFSLIYMFNRLVTIINDFYKKLYDYDLTQKYYTEYKQKFNKKLNLLNKKCRQYNNVGEKGDKLYLNLIQLYINKFKKYKHLRDKDLKFKIKYFTNEILLFNESINKFKSENKHPYLILFTNKNWHEFNMDADECVKHMKFYEIKSGVMISNNYGHFE
jgi:hypothetical protein